MESVTFHEVCNFRSQNDLKMIIITEASQHYITIILGSN